MSKRWSFQVVNLGKVVAESKGQFNTKEEAETAGENKAKALKEKTGYGNFKVRVRRD